eukprot:TRINITY_DN6594_c0_g1_i1.p2 TRINITY_DN6594_c0_g1~~TRINITY_DN6594_c0_g1_i1.p2  ORF type:complete len:449 (+),score=204.09 TRINITY_DN6594_c0_g1_i1:237-1583(+)
MSTTVCKWAVADGAAKVEEITKKYGAKTVRVETRGDLTEDEFRGLSREYIDRSVGTDAEGDSFYVVDIGAIEQKMLEWQAYLPMVRPYYAWKCNGNSVLVEVLAALGAGFDCASRNEFEGASKLPGIVPERDIIFANPCKQVTHCRAASKMGVKMVTYDNEHELPKLKQYWPEAQALLRIVTDDSASICELSSKYGAALEKCPMLIEQAIDLGVDLIGVSFHVGSGCRDATSFVAAARDARKVFDMAAERGLKMKVLDIGGGFPGDAVTTPTFRDIADTLRPVLEELFPDTELIAEPGRYFACASHSLAANIFAKREIDIPRGEDIPRADDGSSVGSESEQDDKELQYYVNEGLYQSFNCVLYDHAIVTPMPLRMRETKESAETDRMTTIFGPTCDGLDCIAKRIPFPHLDIGDWIYFRDFGAYTTAGASSFNGFDMPNMLYVRSTAA